MQSQSGRYYFRDFLRSEYSEENMLFWMACEELKTELQNPEIVEEKARLIYEDYISILSPKEVKKLEQLLFLSFIYNNPI
jgi:regulator of G-protein signaling